MAKPAIPPESKKPVVEVPAEAPAPEQMTPEKAREILAEQTSKRLESCAADVEAALKAHGCAIATKLFWSEDGRALAGWKIVTNE
jgi:hypothetical protein